MKRIHDKKRLDAVADLGCIVCRKLGYGKTPAEVHHLRRNPETGIKFGTRQRAGDNYTIPLCVHHHRGGFGTGFHGGERTFESLYGTEADLWEQTNALLELGQDFAEPGQGEAKDTSAMAS